LHFALNYADKTQILLAENTEKKYDVIIWYTSRFFCLHTKFSCSKTKTKMTWTMTQNNICWTKDHYINRLT